MQHFVDKFGIQALRHKKYSILGIFNIYALSSFCIIPNNMIAHTSAGLFSQSKGKYILDNIVSLVRMQNKEGLQGMKHDKFLRGRRHSSYLGNLSHKALW